MIRSGNSDVINHLSAHGRAGNGTFLPESEPDATVILAARPVESRIATANFAEDFLGEHSPRDLGSEPDAPRNLQK